MTGVHDDSTTSPSVRRDAWALSYAGLFIGLFAACGEASVRTVDAPLCVLYASLSGQFAWHAELLFDLVTPRADAVDDVDDVDGTTIAVTAQLGALAADGDGVSLCVALASLVLPALRAEIDRERAATELLLDGPRARALLLISRDVSDALAASETASERLGGEGAAQSDALASLRRALSDAGSLAGLAGDDSIGRRG
jgi:hypothetical protein